ncbi:hypothetical protein OS493_019994 [Desmophyllum pertusum]|uniref:DUF7789 domain-containing protein n=1 Tax=Desmophyllum pertusum TaxID=174260 RepID=A0A9X0CGA5_9CNID|nr:hypothetical protein OS493_019994 [Desmophyllum pertusum]
MEGSRDKIVPAEEEESDSLGCSEDNIRERTTVTAIGKVKTFAGLEAVEWTFLIISVINVLVAVGLTINRLVVLENDTPDYTFAIILFINIGFCLFYAVHGVLREREFELYAYIVGIIVVLCYISIDLIVNTRTALKWVRLVAMVLLGFPNMYFGIKVAQGFGYLAFKTVGAAEELHRMYRYAGMYSCLLKFDLQLAVSLAVFVIMNVTDLELHDKVTIGIGIPLQLAWSILGWFAMRRELMILVQIFIPLSLVEPAYLIYRINKVATNWSKNTSDGKDVLAYSFLGAASLAFIVRVLVLITLRFVVNNFGKGLKETVFMLPVTGDQPPLFPRKRNTSKCCGIVLIGPLG